MSMTMAVVQGDTAYLYTDTLYADPKSGWAVGFGHKMIAGSRFPSVVGYDLLQPPSPEWQLFDRDPRNVPELLDQLAAAVAAHAAAGLPYLRLVAAVWDERMEAPRLFVAGSDLGTAGHSPHCPSGVGEVRYFAGVEDDLYSRVASVWLGKTPNDPEYFHPEFDAPAAFETQRRRACSAAGTDARCFVGGSLELSRVTRHGVRGTIIYDWPDRLGQPVGQELRNQPACELSPLR